MAPIRIRVRGPSGQAAVVLEGSSTVAELRAAISEKTSLSAFDIKAGYPPMPLDLDQFDSSTKLADTKLPLNGEQLTVSARDIQTKELAVPPSSSNTAPATSPLPALPKDVSSRASQPFALQRKPNPFGAESDSDPPEVPVATHQGSLLLRVMPDDNSCLFRALGTAMLDSSFDVMHELRSSVAQGIQANPELYNAAVLGKEPDDYCKWIQREDSWGGGIEIGLLAQTFGVEVASINVQDLRVDRFNEGSGSENRVIIVYSGIHYDTIAFSPDGCGLPDLDVKQFSVHDEIILSKAVELCAKLQKSHYYTDTAGFELKCNICGWKGKGEKGATKHAEETGHMDFGEA